MPHTTIATPLSRANPGLPPELARITRQPNHIMSHATAAMLWDIHQPRSECPTGQHRMLHGTSTHRRHSESSFDLPHVTVTAEARLPRISAACCHRLNLSPLDITELAGLRLTTPERTWFDLLGQLDGLKHGHSWPPLQYLDNNGSLRIISMTPVEAAVVWAEVLLHRRLATLASLRQQVNLRAGSIGVRRARQAIQYVQRGTRNPTDTLLRLRLEAAGLRPERDVLVPGFPETGRPRIKTSRFALAFPSAQLGVTFQTCDCPSPCPQDWKVVTVKPEHLAQRNGPAQQVEQAFLDTLERKKK